jgi:hypothetical protein
VNELIWELLNKAAYSTGAYPSGQNNSWETQVNFLNKFAQLIVEECLEQGSILAKHYIDTHREQEQVMLLASIADYSAEIKKHFGVES